MPSDDLATLCTRLTYNGAANLRGTVEHPHDEFPDLVNGGQRFSTGLGKWTTLAVIGIRNHLIALKLAEERVLPWHGDYRDERNLPSFCVTPLGREVAQYLHEHWDDVVPTLRDMQS